MDILAENQGGGGGQKTPIGPGTFLCQNHPTKSDITSG